MSGVNLPQRAWKALVSAAFAMLFATSFITSSTTSAWSQSLFGGWFERDRVFFAQPAPYGQQPRTEQPNAVASEDDIAPALQRQIVLYPSKEPAGTIIVDTPHTFLYLTLGGGKAVRYGIGVGRKGFTWSGVERISRKTEWPDWIPPAEMIARQPYLPRWVGGGPGNPLGARALYLGNTDYRIHGTNNPASIGTQVSSGCIRMRNADVIDLYGRVSVGTKVVVLPGDQRTLASDTPVETRPNLALEYSAAGVRTAGISAAPRDMGLYSRGASSESLHSRSLY
jgi:lipoprotein-anchoring transpeptidase ErfK/SrfK